MTTLLQTTREFPGFVYDPSLVLYLPLWKRDGASFMSEDRHGHLCTAYGAVWTPMGRSFDGTDDYLNGGTHTSLDVPAFLTLEAWVYLRTSAWGAIVSKRKGVPWEASYSLEINATTLEFTCDTTATGTGGGGKAHAFPTGVWHHVAGTYDGAALKFFANGEIFGSIALTGLRTQTTNPLMIGDLDETNKEWFNGLIGEVSIWSRALTEHEILNHYLATKWRYQ